MDITLTQSQLEIMASRSLIGLLAKKKIFSPCEITLIFPQTTLRWKEENGGPDSLILPEHCLPLLIKDILFLKDQGFDIKIEMPVQEKE